MDLEGGEYLYIYDEAGKLCGRTDPEGRLTSYTYDENGCQTGTQKRIRDAVEQGIRDTDFSLLSDPKWRDVYDEETLYKIQKRLRQYYDENPEVSITSLLRGEP